jgi:DNA-binding transcriptional MerR regulator
MSDTLPDLIPARPGPRRPAAPASAGSGGDAYSIRALVREFGITARTLRFYEEKGLLSPLREGEARLYSRRDRARLAYVLKGKAIGLSLDEVRELLDLYDLGDGGVTQLKAALAKFAERIDSLTRQRGEIDRMIADLSDAQAMTAGKLSAALRGGAAD